VANANTKYHAGIITNRRLGSRNLTARYAGPGHPATATFTTATPYWVAMASKPFCSMSRSVTGGVDVEDDVRVV
jgi:hypothetical protein